MILAFIFFAFVNTMFFPRTTNTINANAVLLVGNTQAAPSNNQGAPSRNIQVVNLSAQGINYNPSVITVKAGQPVQIVANVASLQGCLKSFLIPSFNIRKFFTPSDNTVEFTPTQKGSFAFSCAMGMGRGTINVI